MPTTPILGITQVSASQNSKEITINDAIIALEAATNAVLAVSFASSSSILLSDTQATRNFIFKPTGGTAACTLKFPNTVNGNNLDRLFAVRNESGYAVTVKFNTGTGSTVLVPNGQCRLIAAIGGNDMIVAAEPATVTGFTSLTDVPASYVSFGGKFLRVNVAENALEFIDGATFPTLSGNAHKVLAVNSGGTGVEWITPATTFLNLTDTPATYTGGANQLVAVKADETGVEFISPPDAEAVEFVGSTKWRIRVLANDVSVTQVGFGEIEFQDVDGIDLTGTGTASSSTHATGKDALYAFDNVTTAGNGWLSAVSDLVGAWIEYDFTTSVVVRHVKLWGINGVPLFTPTEFMIERWDGVSAWIAAGDRTPATWVDGTPQIFKVNGVPLSSIPDAPNDGVTYARKNLTWTALPSVDTDGTLAANSDGAVPSQKAVKTYVDGKVAGLSWKNKVRAATTVNGTLATAYANGSVIDGVTLATGDRILLKDQTTGSENGIYTVNVSGAPTRATDADSAAELISAALYVSEGTTNADMQFVCSNDTLTLGTTAVVFVQFQSGGGVTDGNKGDITVSGAGTTYTINSATVTYGKMQNISATSRILGRKTTGAGSTEELTLSDVLDFVGSAAQGDILYRGASTWARLAAGTSGYVLATQGAGANPQWVAQSGGGSSPGGLTLISEQVATGSSTTLSVTGIPASYKSIIVEFFGKSSGAITVTVNNDGSSLYSVQRVYSGAAFGSGESTIQPSFNALPDTSAGGSSTPANMRMEFANYADTSFYKTMRWQGRQPADTNGDSAYEMVGAGEYRSTSAINRVDIISTSGNWAAGSTMRVYGVGGTASSSGGGDLSYIGLTLNSPAAASFTFTKGTSFTGTLASLSSSKGVALRRTGTTALNAAYAALTAFTPPAAGTDFTIKALFLATPTYSLDGFGIMLKDNAGKIAQFGFRNTDIGGSYWNSESSVSSGFSDSSGMAWHQGPLWMKLTRTGTSFTLYFSADGENWVSVGTHGTTDFLTSTLSSVGFGSWSQNNWNHALTCYHFEAA